MLLLSMLIRGVGVANNLVEAYKAALHCDTTSAFGGIVAVNRSLMRNLREKLPRSLLKSSLPQA